MFDSLKFPIGSVTCILTAVIENLLLNFTPAILGTAILGTARVYEELHGVD